MRLLLLLAVVSGCSPIDDHADHHHGEPDEFAVGGDVHVPRDLATQPCGIDTWEHLTPDLRQCELSGATLTSLNLRRVDLSEADLSSADLTNAQLFKANLQLTLLGSARLVGANLTNADLTGCDLRGADLRGATLTNALFTGCQLSGALTDVSTLCSSGTAGPCW